MSLKHEIEPFNIHGLVEYFGRAGCDSMIDEGSMENSCEHDDGYFSRQWIGFQPYDCFISSTVGHSKVHNDQIGSGRSCLLKRLMACGRFNSVIARCCKIQHKQLPNFRIGIGEQDFLFSEVGAGNHKVTL